MATRLVVVGAGGFARETLDVVEAAEEARPGTWQVVGLVSEVASDHGRDVHGHRVLGGLEALGPLGGASFVVAIGATPVRRRLAEAVESLGLVPATVTHPRATLTRRCAVAPGGILTAGIVLTNAIEIGRHALLNLNCTVGHDARLGDFVTVYPGVHLSGGVAIGEGSEIGTGAVVLPRVTIGAWSVVGAGAVVTADVAPNSVVVGVPGKVIRTRDEGWWRT